MASRKHFEVEGWPGSSFEFEGLGGRFAIPWDRWSIAGLAVDLDGQLLISELCLTSLPGQEIPPGGISAATLNLPIGRIRADVQRTIVKHVEPHVRELQRQLTEHRIGDAKAARRGRRPYSDEELEAIARLYLDLQETRGVVRIAEELAARLDMTVSTVNKRVRRATEAGFLGTAHQGRGGRGPGPRLAKVG